MEQSTEYSELHALRVLEFISGITDMSSTHIDLLLTQAVANASNPKSSNLWNVVVGILRRMNIAQDIEADVEFTRIIEEAKEKLAEIKGGSSRTPK
ncbi:hypothetical protein [Methylobacterium sp. Leaf102]|uniref:hypothetical protein n=1 Tax=Methylobacterium sp. Leaf102 TaxID=1736253 RepID=UPI000A64D5CD|nr:hypothetical protein [Methylobacterium sp. Leaf102]